MNLLIDTHVLLWWADASDRLGPLAREAISAVNNSVWVSAASMWEIAIKSGIGRITFDDPFDVALPRELERSGFRELPIRIVHALAVERLPRHHADPFDRLLVAQARIEGHTLVTADHKISDYDVKVLPANL